MWDDKICKNEIFTAFTQKRVLKRYLNYANDASCLIQQVKMFHSRIQSRAAMEEQPSELITEDAQQQ